VEWIRSSRHRFAKSANLLLVVGSLTGLVGGDLLLDPGLPLLVGELGGLVLLGLGSPLGGVLLGGLELGVLSDGGVGGGEDLLDVLGTDTVGEVGRELLLEPRNRVTRVLGPAQ
jgi:hypothetical protein